MSKTVYIVRGPSGAGKSTYIRERLIGEDSQAVICSADHFFEKTRTVGNPELGYRDETYYDFDVAKLPEAHAQCMEAFLMALIRRAEPIVVDNTSTRWWEYHNYELAARLAGYDVEIIEIVPETIDEVRTCAQRNTHGVPATVIASHTMRFEHDTRAVRVKVNTSKWK